MNRFRVVPAFLACFVASTAVLGADSRKSEDPRLAAARRYVEKSDRYLHHSKLKRGMTGYGLTVVAGTKPVRFKVEIVSVLTGQGKHQDSILAKLSGLGLEKSGVVQGMSGSPCYVRDETDGKDKLIGAVAFGWRFQLEPLCGIQPITQMIAGALPQTPAAKTKPAATKSRPAATGAAPQAYLDAVLNPRKVDFSRFGWPKRLVPDGGDDTVRLRPLATPLMISGARRRTLIEAARFFKPMGLVPTQSGGVGGAEANKAAKVSLKPGSAVAITLVAGDANWAATGTVTDVIGKRVLAFGHGFFGAGRLELPMGPAYVHAIIFSRQTSFKLSSPLAVTGVLDVDEFVGVGGIIGKKTAMVPMTVHVKWEKKNLTQTYRYKLSRHRLMTAVLARFLVIDSTLGWRELPEHHTVSHSVVVNFGKLGVYRSADVASDADLDYVLSDMTRPLAAMLSNPFGPPQEIKNISVDIKIREGTISAGILQMKLDGVTYKPGDTVTGKVTLSRFRKTRTQMPIKFQLPDDLPEGTYTLTACGASGAIIAYKKENPQLFSPRSVKELFASVQRIVRPGANKLYLRLPLAGGGLAIGQKELPDLPPSKAAILMQSKPLDLSAFRRANVQTVKSDYLIRGSAGATFTVRLKPTETRVNEK